MNSNISLFYRLVDEAGRAGNTELVKNLFYTQEILTENLELRYTGNLELLEMAIRTLVRADLDLGFAIRFILLDCPQDLVEFMEWFVRFFVLIESLDDTGHQLTDEHRAILYSEFSPFTGELDGVYPNYNSLDVSVHVSSHV